MGLAKAYNGGELGSPSDAPDSITYNFIETIDGVMALTIQSAGGGTDRVLPALLPHHGRVAGPHGRAVDRSSRAELCATDAAQPTLLAARAVRAVPVRGFGVAGELRVRCRASLEHHSLGSRR